MKLVKHLARLGYGSRREVQNLLRAGAFTTADGSPLDPDRPPPHHAIRHHGEPLDPDFPLVLMLHKPLGHTCGTPDPGPLIYDLLPPRFLQRNPPLSSVGRLDKDSSGILLLTDDGSLLHRLIHPKSGCAKTYRVTLDRPLQGHEADLFATGSLQLHGETKPLLPATLQPLGSHQALVTLHEGRYHQVRRMFAACGNHVTALHRQSFGPLPLPPNLPPGSWRTLTETELDLLLSR